MEDHVSSSCIHYIQRGAARVLVASKRQLLRHCKRSGDKRRHVLHVILFPLHDNGLNGMQRAPANHSVLVREVGGENL